MDHTTSPGSGAHDTPPRRPILRRPPTTSSEASNKPIDRARTRSSPSLASNAVASSSTSASSSTTSLPRSIHPSVRGGTLEKRRSDLVGSAESVAHRLTRPRTLSASSSAQSHGRQSVKARPPTPGTTTSGGSHPSLTSTPHAQQQRFPPPPPPQSKVSPKPSQIPRTSYVKNPPSPPGNAGPSRRPSLASPLPATPIIPSHLPRPAVRTAPAPLNLTPPVSPPRQHHAATGSLSSPHSPAFQAHLSTPPQSATVNHAQQAWTSHAQYITVPRVHAHAPPSGSLSDASPATTQALMRRLLAKPAPVSPAHRGAFGGASGSDSEGPVRRSHYFVPRAVKTDGEEDIPSARKLMGMGIDFDMDTEALDRNVASLGNWAYRSTEKVVVPVTPLSAGKEKEKAKDNPEKRPRNVLRRRPSASTQSPSSSKSSSRVSTPANLSRLPSISAPRPSSPKNIDMRNPRLPPLAPFPPLSISPPTKGSVEVKIEHNPKPHDMPNRSVSKNMHRSASASAALPATAGTGRIPRVHAALNALHSQQHPPSPDSRRASHIVPQPPGRPQLQHPPLSPAYPRSPAPPIAAANQQAPRHPYPRMRPAGARSSASQGSSQSSVVHSPRLPGSTLVAPPPAPQSAAAGAPPLSPALSASSSSKRTSVSSKPTPAASLVEAYQRQEREREARRLAAEEERAQMRRDAGRAVTDAQAGGSSSARPGMRRHSISGIDALVDEKHRAEDASGYLSVQGVHPRTGSSLTVDSVATEQTTDSGPMVDEDGSASDVSRAGGRFAAIEKIAATGQPASTGAGQKKLVKSISMGSPLNASIQKRSQRSGTAPEEEDITPYYTVLGSSSTRVAAGPSAEVGWSSAFSPGHWEVDVLGQRMTVSGGGIAREKEGKVKESLGRTLSRKVSSRWKKQGGQVVSAIGDEERKGRALAPGRTSMQEKRKNTSTPRKELASDGQETKIRHRRSLRLSIDKFSDLLDDQPPIPSRRVAPRAAAAPTPAVPVNDEQSPGHTPTEKADKQKFDRQRKSEASPTGSTSGGGNKFWKLMRRISVGGLKEKYHDATPPPPVPALPKELRSPLPPLRPSVSHESTSKTQESRPQEISTGKKSRALSSSPTAPVHVSRIPLRHHKSSTVVVSSSAPGPSNQPRPSTTTVSSSPVSSDMASSKLFYPAQSAQSSTSSFDHDKPPPLPPKLARHIIPPSELDRSYRDDRSVRPSRTRGISESTHRPSPPPFKDEEWAKEWTILPSPAVELQSLPFPPRRPPAAPMVSVESPDNDDERNNDSSRSESPTIPSFSTTAAVNAFPSRRLSAALSAKSRQSPSSPYAQSPSSMMPTPAIASPSTTTPPPRPLRSAQRPSPGHSAPILEEPAPSPRPPIIVHDMDMGIVSGRRSESHAQHRQSSGGLSAASSIGTARAYRRSSSFGASTSTAASIISSMSPPATPAGDATLVFRELGDAQRRQVLTETEKAARWDDLLERSARAGGTLHLAGGSRLGSDRTRSPRT